MRALCLHLLSHLDQTELLGMAEGDQIVQQSHLVLLEGSLGDGSGNLFADAAVLEHKSRRKLYARKTPTVVLVFSPSI